MENGVLQGAGARLEELSCHQATSLVEFLAGAVGVVQQELARCELAAVHGLVLAQFVHELPRAVGVREPEGTCGDRDTAVTGEGEAPRCLEGSQHPETTALSHSSFSTRDPSVSHQDSAPCSPELGRST